MANTDGSFISNGKSLSFSKIGNTTYSEILNNSEYDIKVDIGNIESQSEYSVNETEALTYTIKHKLNETDTEINWYWKRNDGDFCTIGNDFSLTCGYNTKEKPISVNGGITEINFVGPTISKEKNRGDRAVRVANPSITLTYKGTIKNGNSTYLFNIQEIDTKNGYKGVIQNSYNPVNANYKVILDNDKNNEDNATFKYGNLNIANATISNNEIGKYVTNDLKLNIPPNIPVLKPGMVSGTLTDINASAYIYGNIEHKIIYKENFDFEDFALPNQGSEVIINKVNFGNDLKITNPNTSDGTKNPRIFKISYNLYTYGTDYNHLNIFKDHYNGDLYVYQSGGKAIPDPAPVFSYEFKLITEQPIDEVTYNRYYDGNSYYFCVYDNSGKKGELSGTLQIDGDIKAYNDSNLTGCTYITGLTYTRPINTKSRYIDVCAYVSVLNTNSYDSNIKNNPFYQSLYDGNPFRQNGSGELDGLIHENGWEEHPYCYLTLACKPIGATALKVPGTNVFPTFGISFDGKTFTSTKNGSSLVVNNIKIQAGEDKYGNINIPLYYKFGSARPGESTQYITGSAALINSVTNTTADIINISSSAQNINFFGDANNLNFHSGNSLEVPDYHWQIIGEITDGNPNNNHVNSIISSNIDEVIATQTGVPAGVESYSTAIFSANIGMPNGTEKFCTLNNSGFGISKNSGTSLSISNSITLSVESNNSYFSYVNIDTNSQDASIYNRINIIPNAFISSDRTNTLSVRSSISIFDKLNNYSISPSQVSINQDGGGIPQSYFTIGWENTSYSEFELDYVGHDGKLYYGKTYNGVLTGNNPISINIHVSTTNGEWNSTIDKTIYAKVYNNDGVLIVPPLVPVNGGTVKIFVNRMKWISENEKTNSLVLKNITNVPNLKIDGTSIKKSGGLEDLILGGSSSVYKNYITIKKYTTLNGSQFDNYKLKKNNEIVSDPNLNLTSTYAEFIINYPSKISSTSIGGSSIGGSSIGIGGNIPISFNNVSKNGNDLTNHPWHATKAPNTMIPLTIDEYKIIFPDNSESSISITQDGQLNTNSFTVQCVDNDSINCHVKDANYFIDKSGDFGDVSWEFGQEYMNDFSDVNKSNIPNVGVVFYADGQTGNNDITISAFDTDTYTRNLTCNVYGLTNGQAKFNVYKATVKAKIKNYNNTDVSKELNGSVNSPLSSFFVNTNVQFKWRRIYDNGESIVSNSPSYLWDFKNESKTSHTVKIQCNVAISCTFGTKVVNVGIYSYTWKVNIDGITTSGQIEFDGTSEGNNYINTQYLTAFDDNGIVTGQCYASRHNVIATSGGKSQDWTLSYLPKYYLVNQYDKNGTKSSPLLTSANMNKYLFSNSYSYTIKTIQGKDANNTGNAYMIIEPMYVINNKPYPFNSLYTNSGPCMFVLNINTYGKSFYNA